MRGSRLIALLPALALATACKDEGGGAFVDTNTNWQVFCTGIACTFQPHEATEKVDIKVSCKRDALGLTVTLRGPADGSTMPPTPAGTLTVSRINPAAGTCAVEVSDTQTIGGNPITLSDQCPATAATGKCTLTGAENVDGWDFVGQLKCDNLTQGRLDPMPYLLRAKGMTNPINLAVDCG
jgi:hypothetical protein